MNRGKGSKEKRRGTARRRLGEKEEAGNEKKRKIVRVKGRERKHGRGTGGKDHRIASPYACTYL